MRYNTVLIQENWDSAEKLKWEVHVRSDRIDRVDTETVPNSLGFFHFPETMLPEKAFEKLRRKMVNDRREFIERLEQEISGLERLEL
jgi:hypothetical protein